MQENNTGAGQSNARWSIDTGWLEEKGRSFPVLAKGVLCPKCHQKLKPDTKVVSNEKLIKAVKDCCSKSPEFIHTRMPVMASVFRLMLANGNKPMAMEDIVKQLGDRWGVGMYRLPDATLNSLLQADKYYGLRQALK